MIPLRLVSETLDYETNWQPDGSIHITSANGAVDVTLAVDSTAYTADGVAGTFETAPTLKNDRTYLPARDFAELYGSIYWDGDTRTVWIAQSEETMYQVIGEKVLRAKIDMASPNINMRDPVIYRIAHVSHHQTGDKWCVYPMYDFAHPLSDAAEKVTYSLCSLEFENHRPLYNWFIDAIGFEEPPRQIEFARLNLNYCVTSKRKCLEMVQNGVVNGWDDPRMVTLCGMRRRGYPAAAIRDFIGRVGVAKAYSVVDYGLLEACVRDNLNQNAPRAMAVLNPLKLVIDNYPEGKTEEIEVEINPDKPELGRRKVTFSRELYVEREDFMAEPVKKYFRLFPGNEVRLKSAYYVTCNSYDTDENGEVTCLHCTYDPESRGGETPDGRKVRGTLHWVSAADNVKAQVRLYDRLFNTENPAGEDGNGDYLQNINPDSLKIIDGCLLEGGLRDAKPGDTFQFMRQGYFCVDKDSTPGNLIINRTVALNSSWDKKKK